MKRFYLSLLFLLPSLLFSENPGSWGFLDLKWYKGERLSFKTHGELRGYERIDGPETWLVSQRAAYALFDCLSLGLNYTYIEAFSDEWRYQHRIEFEANPSFSLSDCMKVTVRNRLEIRKIEGRNWNNTRLRTRFQVSKKLCEFADTLFASEEIFYDFRTDRFSESRLVPVGLKWKMNDHFDLSAFYLFRTRRFKNGWDHTHVFGLALALDLSKVYR